MNSTTRRGVYPGSFNPPTTAHLAIAATARREHDLDLIVWSVSAVALAKESVQWPRLIDRMAVLADVAASHEWLAVQQTDDQLVADIAAGFDVVIMGADKWAQVQDPVFYGDDPAARDAAIASLPTIAVAPREDIAVPNHLVLPVDGTHGVSSTAAREGEATHMLDAAIQFDALSGAWSDPAKYEAWVTHNPDGRPQ